MADNESERHVIRWWAIGAFIFDVVLTCVEGTLLSREKHISAWSQTVFEAVCSAVIPNFIAGLFTFFIGYFVILEDRRVRYIKAMRTIRSAVRDLRETVGIEPKKAQDLMERVVPAISDLYFKTDEPPVPRKDKEKEYPRTKCFTCDVACPVVGGACGTCRDLLASWKEEEREPAVSAPGPS